MFYRMGNLQFNVLITFGLRHVWNKMSHSLFFAEYCTEWKNSAGHRSQIG